MAFSEESFMIQIRFTIFAMLALSILPGMLAAQGPRDRDEGEYVILNAQYGSERNHVNVTERLKFLARQDRPFRVSHDSMNVDPDEGHAKVLRIYAGGPNGRERMLEYRDNSVIDGAQFRGWGRGEWGNGNDHWSGRWEGEEREERERDRDRDRDRQ